MVKKKNPKKKEEQDNKKNKFWDKKLNRISIFFGIILTIILITERLFNISNLLFNQQEASIIIKGKILNSTLEPIQDVLITINAVHFKTKSRRDGAFVGKIKGKSKGDKILLTVSHLDYQTRKFERIISSNKETFGEIILQK